nr:MAG TPA_asm: hypothetical protein [Caudoviricetes sp.]
MFWVVVGLGIAWFMSKDEYVFKCLSAYTDSIAKWFKRERSLHLFVSY